MKHFYILLTAIFFSAQIQAQNAPFITTWEVYQGFQNITIPTIGTGYNYTVDFGDGTVLTNQTGDSWHTYSSSGIYSVTISGDFPRIRFGNNSTNAPKLKTIEQWGDNEWISMESAFMGCSSLTLNATDTPDLSQVTDMSHMFNGTNSLNQSINHWDVSNVTNMASMFELSTYNQPLNNWDVSNVTNMSRMFYFTEWSFNPPLNNWDVSSVTDMSEMFSYSYYFNQPLDNWDVSSVTNMKKMFNKSQFNQPINNWDVFNVIDMLGMFADTPFNQPLNDWDVSNVMDMRAMFASAFSFNQPLDNWDVSNVMDMGGMFSSAESFNQPLNDWDVSNVIHMSNMFHSAISFNQPLNNWNVSNVSTMFKMFAGAISFNQPLDNWDVSNVRYINNMFNNAQSFNQDLSHWQFYQFLFRNGGLEFFLSNSGLDSYNYDVFLDHLATLDVNFGTLGADNLEYCNSPARDYIINHIGWISGDVLSTSCNRITGTILYDQNSNGCDPNDIEVEGFMIAATNGSYEFITYSSIGNYDLSIYGSNFTVSVVNQPSLFTVTPASVPVIFTTAQTEIVDFCVTVNQSINDLNVTLLPPNEARPGFEADYRLVIRNVGTETIANVDATLQFDDLMQQFVNSTPAPGTTTANMLTFPIGTLQPFQKFEADITMLTFQPPTVNGGDILNFTANVTPAANDFTPIDNTFNMAQVVVNSYDPNDKQVLQGEELHIDKTDEYLDYLIRFQNTGTASAINVRILDTLHPKLDWNTLVPISASHDYYVKIKDGNHVEFMFDNIHLADSTSNEPASHGFVAYKIKPKNNVQVGDIISGNAGIYFDFNPPIITNTVYTHIVEPLGVEDISGPEGKFVIYPNPTGNILNIYHPAGIQWEKIVIYDLQGRKIKEFIGNNAVIDVSLLDGGIYFLQINSSEGTFTKRMNKK